MKRAMAKEIKLQQQVDEFNTVHIKGHLFEYRGFPDAPPRLVRTTSDAWVLSGHSPVVMVDGVSGCVHLTALREPKTMSDQKSQEVFLYRCISCKHVTASDTKATPAGAAYCRMCATVELRQALFYDPATQTFRVLLP